MANTVLKSPIREGARPGLFSGLRFKLILTYTLVTVMALLALEILVLAAILAVNSLLRIDQRDYLGDVIRVMGPQASDYLQPGKENQPGLQAWLEKTSASGYASSPPLNVFDSPAARLAQGHPLLVITPDKKVIAQAPAGAAGDQDLAAGGALVERALAGESDILRLVKRPADGSYLLAFPVRQSAQDSSILAVILLTVRPAPSMLPAIISTMLGWVLLTGIILLVAVAPFGALFGFIMSSRLTRRLDRLARATDAWSVGDFRAMPADRSKDEIGVLAYRMRNMAERLQNLLHGQQQLAMIEERNRLARELHDTVKQQTFATLMQVRAARNQLESDPNSARQCLEEAERLIKTSQQELGLIISELRPAALEGQGLAGALREHLESWSKYTRIPAALNVQGERALPLETEQALYRVAQEALSNVARHSSASSATVRLVYEPGRVSLAVEDNGLGFDPAGPLNGYGIQGMKERLSPLGGNLEIESAPGNGTCLAACVPLKKEEGKP